MGIKTDPNHVGQAKQSWNAQADQWNQWDNLGKDEKDDWILKSFPPEHTQDWYQAFMDARSHLLAISSVVIKGNQSAAIQFALQTRGILEQAAPSIDMPTDLI